MGLMVVQVHFPCWALGGWRGSPQLHVAAEMVLYLHYQQCKVPQRCKCHAGANALCLLKEHLNRNMCFVNKTFGVFQTVLWPGWYLQLENGWCARLKCQLCPFAFEENKEVFLPVGWTGHAAFLMLLGFKENSNPCTDSLINEINYTPWSLADTISVTYLYNTVYSMFQ